MRESFLSRIVLPAAIVIAGFAAIFFLSSFIEHRRPALPDEYVDSDLNLNGSSLKGYAFGMEGLIADWYFTRSLQYIGYKLLSREDGIIDIENLRDLNPRLLYPMLQNATDLDPHFLEAYSYGAVVLPAIDPQNAVDLTNKGIANNPDTWRLYQHLAFIYWKIGAYDKAAETYERGSQIAGAAPFMKLMAASMKTEGGSRETARAIYQQMLDNSDDEQVRITAVRRLNELDSLDERDAIDKVLTDVRERTGRCPGSLSEIFPTLKKIDLPGDNEFLADRSNQLVDPSGVPYLLDREKCVVKIDLTRTGLPAR